MPPRARTHGASSAAARQDRGETSRGGARAVHVVTPALRVLGLQASAGNAAVARMLRTPLGVARKPSDFASTPAATLKSGWGFLGVFNTPWENLRDALRGYAALREDDHAGRSAALQTLPALIAAWEVHHNVGAATLNDDEKAKVAALVRLRALIDAEHRELARGGAGVDERRQAVKAPRFKGDYLLEQVMTGQTTLVKTNSGLYVTKLQQALSDLGHLASDKVNGAFDDDTAAGVRAFQAACGLTQSGTVDKATFTELDTRFRSHGAERTLAQAPAVAQKGGPGEYAWGTAPAALLTGTHDLSADVAAAAKEAVKTSQTAGAGGALPTFKPVGYKAKLKAAVLRGVEWQYKRIGEGKASKRSPSDLFDWAHIDAIAAKSKVATDAIFGKYAIGPPLQHGVSIHDAWDVKVNLLKDPTERDNAARWRVDKLLTGEDEIKQIDKEHGAIQSRAAEKAIVDEVRDEVIKAKKAELLEIHKGWPAFAGGGAVNLQRFKEDTDERNRDAMWDLFGTVVHEYLHTLEHSRHRAYRSTLGQQEGDFTLREGVVEYFTHTVLESVTYTDSLRKDVEGPFHDPAKKHPIPRYQGYGERMQAEKLAGVVGARNVMAAFFLGDVDKIKGA